MAESKKQLRIVVFDPDIEKNQALITILQKMGLETVFEVCSYQSVEQVANNYSPDLFIVGSDFEEKPLGDLISEVISTQATAKLPCILHSRHNDPSSIRHLIGQGITAVIDYPATEESIRLAFRRKDRLAKSKGLADLIRKAAFFTGFGSEDLRALAKVTVTRRFQAGETIIEQEDPADTFYVLLQGKVEAVVVEDGKAALSVPIHAGNPFGEMGVLDNSLHGACCIAADDCVVLEIGSHILKDGDYSLRLKIIARLAEILVQRLRTMNGMLRELTPPADRDPIVKPQKPASVEEKPPVSDSDPQAEAESAVEEERELTECTEKADNEEGTLSLEDVTIEGEDEELYAVENVSLDSNPYASPTAICDEIDPSVSTQEAYDVLNRKVKLRSDFIAGKVPKVVRELVHNKLYGYWTGGKLAKFNPHQHWPAKLFTSGSCVLKRSLHLVVLCPWGYEAYEKAYLGLPFCQRVVGLSDIGCAGTFLGSDEDIERFLIGRSLSRALKHDLEIPIDRLWKGIEAVEFLTHTLADMRPHSLVLVFDNEEGSYTEMAREALPNHQILTVVQGCDFDLEDRSSLFTQPEEILKSKDRLVAKQDYKGRGFYLGETVFLPDLSYFFRDSDHLAKMGYIFGTIGLLSRLGPDFSGITWGSKGGADGAVRAARAMYGIAGAQSAKQMADAINWADQ